MVRVGNDNTIASYTDFQNVFAFGPSAPLRLPKHTTLGSNPCNLEAEKSQATPVMFLLH